MFRSVLIPCLALAAWAGIAQADPHIVYTPHTLTVDAHGLDLSRDADRRVLQARIADAADKVCQGRPDKGDRYSAEERKVLLPAYEKCYADATGHALATVHFPVNAEVAEVASQPRHTSP